MAGQIIYQVDAFTTEIFRGNPAGVCLLDGPRPEEWMVNVAREMNLSETAFLYAEGSGFRLRWFTPKVEVGLCGHATLASAHVLWESGALRADQQAQFETKSGTLTANKSGDWIALNFPARPLTAAEPPAGLLAALGVQAPLYIGRYNEIYLIEVASEDIVRGLSPEFSALAQVKIRSVAVTARGQADEFDFVSRYFAPAVGVNEDPVTGSVHCMLAPYWSGKLGKAEMMAYQASARGGVLRVKPDGERVIIEGQAVTFFKAEMKG